MSRSTDMATLRAELLQWIADRTQYVLAQHGVAEAVAEQCGCALADDIAAEWGGQVISIPKDHFFKMAARDREVLAARQANESVASIALRMGMTTRGVRYIIDRASHRDPHHHRQPPLF